MGQCCPICLFKLICSATNQIWGTWHVYHLHVVMLTVMVSRCWIVCLTSWHLVPLNAVMSAKLASLCSVQVWGISAMEIWQGGPNAKTQHLNRRESLSECLRNSHWTTNSCNFQSTQKSIQITLLILNAKCYELLHFTIFWGVVPQRLIDRYQFFGGMCCLHLPISMFIWNVSTSVPDYAAYQPRRQIWCSHETSNLMKLLSVIHCLLHMPYAFA